MFNRGAKGAPMKLDYSYNGTEVKTNNASSYTFVGVSIGVSHAERMVVCCIMGQGTIGFSSATIGGVAASVVSSTYMAHIIYAKVPSGSTGDVVINYATAVSNCRIACYSFNTKATVKLDSVAQTKVLSTLPITLSNVQCSDGGVVLSCFSGAAAGSTSGSWNGTDSYAQDGNGLTETGRYGYGHVLTTEASSIRDLVHSRGDAQVIYSGAAVSFEFIE